MHQFGTVSCLPCPENQPAMLSKACPLLSLPHDARKGCLAHQILLPQGDSSFCSPHEETCLIILSFKESFRLLCISPPSLYSLEFFLRIVYVKDHVSFVFLKNLKSGGIAKVSEPEFIQWGEPLSKQYKNRNIQIRYRTLGSTNVKREALRLKPFLKTSWYISCDGKLYILGSDIVPLLL